MNVKEAVFSAMEDVLGLEKAELEENLDMDLLQSGIVDSLVIVTLISEVEQALGKKIAIKKMDPVEFSTINRLTAAIEKQL